jgi:hypothetical protein
MAPSVFNTQPWRIEVVGSTIELAADPDRTLYWSVDPYGRQAVVSCGAALFNMRVAAAHLGREVQVDTLPDDTGLLARLVIGPRCRGDAADAKLHAAIRHRHTHRGPFAPRQVPGAVRFELVECARAEQATLVSIGGAQRRWLFDLVAFAEIILGQSPGYQADLFKWTGGGASRVDGIPVGAFGALSHIGAPPMRDFGSAHGIAQRHEPFSPDPLVAILSTRADDTAAWLRAGQALQRVLLTARQRGLAASFLNQPLDDPAIRRDMVSAGLGGFPQMILRLGYADGDVATPRRPIYDFAPSARMRA